MACGDPLQTTTLAHLPDARNNIAAVGIARSIAIFFESPIIMILHASNALAPNPDSRKALWRFVLLMGSGLSALLVLIAFPFIFAIVGDRVLGIPPTLLPIAQQVLLLMGPWAGAIAWRRYFQGLLIHHGQANAVAQASLWRLGTVALILGVEIFAAGSGRYSGWAGNGQWGDRRSRGGIDRRPQVTRDRFTCAPDGSQTSGPADEFTSGV